MEDHVNAMESPVLPEVWANCLGNVPPGEEESGLHKELTLAWQALHALGEALERPAQPASWVGAINQTVECLKLIRSTYAPLAVENTDGGFSGRFQTHFELETLGLEPPGTEFLFCDSLTTLVDGACAQLEARLRAMGESLADAKTRGSLPELERAARANGYRVKRGLEQVVVLLLEQLPLDTPSRSMVPGFRSALADSLAWVEMLGALAEDGHNQRHQERLRSLLGSEAAGVLSPPEYLEVEEYQELKRDDLVGLGAALAAQPLVERALASRS